MMETEKFLQARFAERKEEVPVPKELHEFFPGQDKPVWVVRGLSGPELGRINQEAQENQRKSIAALVEAFAGEGDKTEALKKAFGLGDDVPGDISKRISLLALASVEPEIGFDRRDVIVKLCEVSPTFFFDLSNKVYNLTGQGSELGKPKPSGK